MEQLRESTNEEDQQSIQEYMGIDETAAESRSREETGNGLPEESSSEGAEQEERQLLVETKGLQLITDI